jgi:hypothetical protein
LPWNLASPQKNVVLRSLFLHLNEFSCSSQYSFRPVCYSPWPTIVRVIPSLFGVDFVPISFFGIFSLMIIILALTRRLCWVLADVFGTCITAFVALWRMTVTRGHGSVLPEFEANLIHLALLGSTIRYTGCSDDVCAFGCCYPQGRLARYSPSLE